MMPYGFGEEFPAFLTYQAGVDKVLIDLMRPAFDKGMRPEAFSMLLLELHSKKYHSDYIKREHSLERLRLLGADISEKKLFSHFGDKMQYDSLVPRGKYLLSVYISLQEISFYNITFF